MEWKPNIYGTPKHLQEAWDPTDVVYATLRTSCLEDYQHYTLLLFFIDNLSQHLG